MKNFNEKLAQILGNTLSSVWFFYICILLDLIELPPVMAMHDTVLWCTYLSQSVIQLVALPILGAQQKLSHKRHEEHSKHLTDVHKKLDRLLAKKK